MMKIQIAFANTNACNSFKRKTELGQTTETWRSFFRRIRPVVNSLSDSWPWHGVDPTEGLSNMEKLLRDVNIVDHRMDGTNKRFKHRKASSGFDRMSSFRIPLNDHAPIHSSKTTFHEF